uniref:Right handed beta helix domain-containing protein n=1 Tax=Amphimedon queenslandica TaxID=400682 RepID=A0A1X7V8D8_AMPQE
MIILLLCIFVHSVSSFNIRIDGNNGIDSIECLTEQPQYSCQSLKYVADTINNTGNLTIEIISPTLSLQGSVIFTDINGLTINGQGTIINCSYASMLYGNSGIVFNKCSIVALIGFTIEHCGLLYKKDQKYYGRQSVLFYNCKNFNVAKVNFSDNNGYGLVLYESSSGSVMHNLFINNGIKHYRAEELNATGGGLHILQYNLYNSSMSTNIISIASNQFVNNSATTMGGALYMEVDHCANLLLCITFSNFIGNRAGTAGGAIGFIVHKTKCSYNSTTMPLEFVVALISCNITNNMAKFGGGIAIQIVHLAPGDVKEKEFHFEFCYFTGNKAVVSSAVDVSGRRQKIYKCLETVIKFERCYFIENIAGIDINQQELNGKLFKATLYAADAFVDLFSKISFINNSGTALYAVNSRLHISYHARINFSNNTGDRGGAIFLAEDSVMTFLEGGLSFINISNNRALIGGAIYIQSSINLHEGTCFIFQPHDNVTFHFTNNNATSKFGRDIFASTFQDCIQLYGGNVSTIFTSSKMGKFEFSSPTPPPVATAPVKLSIIDEEELSPYPGIPYNMTITQMDEFDNTITNLQLFPLSATLQNVHSSSLKIDITYSIANSYIIVFKGTVGDTATLLLQTTEYSARKLINITLYHCPPGYIFQIDTCHCKSNYYYGISGRLEDNAAVIDGGLWAGYIKEKFATADCVTSLCNYHNSKGNRHEDHVLPLNYSLLNDHVCGPHRNGVLCGSCITGYTTYLHSPSYHCGESTHCQYGPLLYIISEIIPVTGIFLVILFFNINLTSGALYSFIFYSQVVNNHYRNTVYQSYSGPLVYFFHAFKMIYGIFDLETFEIDQLSFCLFKDATIMDLMMIKYLTTLYAFLLIIITILLLKFHSFHCCIKLCHKCGRKNIRGSIVNALTAFLVLCYFRCLIITLYILFPSYVKGDHEVTLKTVPLYNGDMSYLSHNHLKYVTPALICLMVIILPPPIILLSEPLMVRVSGVLNIRRNVVTYTLHRLRMKLKPFLDSFQGCFKDNCRCFAGLFFLYRILPVLIPIYFSDGKFWNIMTKELLILCILFLHCLCAPFQEIFHNHMNSFLLIDLILINTLQIAPLNTNNSTTTLVAVFEVVLMSLPLAYLLCYIGWYTCCRKHCIQIKFNAIISPSGHNTNDDDNDELPQRLLPDFTKSYGMFNKSD